MRVINANNEFNNSLKPILEHFKDIDNDNGGNNQFLYDSLISSLDLMPALLKTAAQNMTTFTQWYTDSKADPANIFTYMSDALVQCENSISHLIAYLHQVLTIQLANLVNYLRLPSALSTTHLYLLQTAFLP